jgi:hypothetical protein
MSFTAWLLLGNLLALVAYDLVVAFVLHNPPLTISRTLADANPLVSLAILVGLGLLLWHLYVQLS